jgi:hypothetical protein
MSKQNSFDEYFVKGKESNENIITQSNIVASQPDYSTVNNIPTGDIQSIDSNSITRYPPIILNPLITILN